MTGDRAPRSARRAVPTHRSAGERTTRPTLLSRPLPVSAITLEPSAFTDRLLQKLRHLSTQRRLWRWTALQATGHDSLPRCLMLGQRAPFLPARSDTWLVVIWAYHTGIPTIPAEFIDPTAEIPPAAPFPQVIPSVVQQALDHCLPVACPFCGQWLTPFPPTGCDVQTWYRLHMPTMDHIVPRAAGGSLDLSNLRWVCRRCNFARGRRMAWTAPAAWREQALAYNRTYGFTSLTYPL